MSIESTEAEKAARAEKVAKLLAKAERASTEEEADAFFAKAQDLITRWGIEEAMLAAAGRGSEDKVITEAIVIKRSGFFKVMQELATQVARANSCRVLLRQPKDWANGSGVLLVGWKSDIERVKLLYTSLLLQSIRASRSVPDTHSDDPKRAAYWRRDFRMGYAVRIGQRLREQVERTKQEVKQESGQDFLPALRSRQAPVDELLNRLAGKPGRASRTKYDPYAYSAGHAAANSADLGNTRMPGSRKALT